MRTNAQRRNPLLVVAVVLAALLIGWKFYSPQGRAKAAEKAAIDACRDVDPAEHLSVVALYERHKRCDRMEAAYRAKWHD